MLKPFVVAFDNTQINRQAVLDFLDTRPEVKNWFAFMPSAIFIISDKTASQIAEAIRSGLPGKNLFVSEVPRGANDGWLGGNVWDFINTPKSTGRWPS